MSYNEFLQMNIPSHQDNQRSQKKAREHVRMRDISVRRFKAIKRAHEKELILQLAEMG